jgi:3-isopropylmalate/(R)-2-methylmalate dehydratase large subunit
MAAANGDRRDLVQGPVRDKVNLTGKMQIWVSGKDVILHLIGLVGVDGALYGRSNSRARALRI